MTDDRLRGLLRDAEGSVRADPARLLLLLPSIERERVRAGRRSWLLTPWLSVAAAIIVALGVGAVLVSVGRLGPATSPPAGLIPLPGFQELSLTPPWIRPAGDYLRLRSELNGGRLTETWLGIEDVDAIVAGYLQRAPAGLSLERTNLPDGGVRLVALGTDPALSIVISPTTRLGMRASIVLVITDVPGGPFDAATPASS